MLGSATRSFASDGRARQRGRLSLGGSSDAPVNCAQQTGFPEYWGAPMTISMEAIAPRREAARGGGNE